MASTQKTTLSILLTLAAFASSCDQGGSAPSEAQSDGEFGRDEVEEQLAPVVELDSDVRDRLLAQFDARGVDRSDVDSCGDAGLLASVVGAEGRHFTFCGDGTVMQLIPPGVDGAHHFASKDVVARIREVAPKSAEVPDSVSLYEMGSGGVADPLVAGFDYEPLSVSSLELRNACNDVRSDCEEMEEWADDYANSNSSRYSMSWCRNRDRPRTFHRRTFSVQLGVKEWSLVTDYEGIAFISACAGEKVRLRGGAYCASKDQWYTKYKKTVNEYERAEIEMGMGVKLNSCNGKMADDIRFTGDGGKFVSGGAYGVNYLTF